MPRPARIVPKSATLLHFLAAIIRTTIKGVKVRRLGRRHRMV